MTKASRFVRAELGVAENISVTTPDGRWVDRFRLAPRGGKLVRRFRCWTRIGTRATDGIVVDDDSPEIDALEDAWDRHCDYVGGARPYQDEDPEYVPLVQRPAPVPQYCTECGRLDFMCNCDLPF